MKSTIVKVEKKRSKGIGATTLSMKNIVYYKTEDGKLAIIEAPSDVDLAKLTSVKLHFAKAQVQVCALEAAPSTKGLYTLANDFFSAHGYDTVQDVETSIKKQLNLGTYEYTVNALRIFGQSDK